jgi:glycine cleavage system H protein
MSHAPVNSISYRRSRFSTKLPDDRLYTPSHFWLREVEPGLWRVGVTRFAQRMLGDLVEYGFEVKDAQAVELGDIIGWIEAFKATTDVYCVGTGTFVRGNPVLETDPRRFDLDPYNEGWLYELRGTPDPNAVDAKGYTRLLDLAIDKIQGKEAMMDRPPTDEVGD